MHTTTTTQLMGWVGSVMKNGPTNNSAAGYVSFVPKLKHTHMHKQNTLGYVCILQNRICMWYNKCCRGTTFCSPCKMWRKNTHIPKTTASSPRVEVY